MRKKLTRKKKLTSYPFLRNVDYNIDRRMDVLHNEPSGYVYYGRIVVQKGIDRFHKRTVDLYRLVVWWTERSERRRGRRRRSERKWE